MVNQPNTSAQSVEARVNRKVKARILPFILLLYIVAFLDRINIGFAALTMNPELGITSQQFGLLAGIFFISYFICEIPSNLLLHKIGARVWLARILITWGIVASLTGFVQTLNQLYVARFLLGLAEGGYFPGMLLYLTYWFRQRDQAQAIAFVLIGIPLTSIVGAPVSGIILDHVHWLGLSSWRWLLILEGLPAVVCGVLTYYLLPNRPAEARFLTNEEKDWVIGRLKLEEEEKRRISPLSATRALLDGRVWHLACIAFTLATAVYIASFWMPQIVKALSSRSSSTMVGFLVMIPNVAGLLLMLVISRNSDRTQERRWHTAVPAFVGGLACLSLGATHSMILSIALLALFAVGFYGAMAPFWALPSEFLSGSSAASGIALVASIGTVGGLFGPYAAGFIRHRTGSLFGGVAVAGIALLALATLVLLLPRVTPGQSNRLARSSSDS
jgi:ACS family tartrate transporter-like MFS transporter